MLSFNPPPQLGPYHLEEEIGRGGMGVVYRARHQSSGQKVALKFLLYPNYEGQAKALIDEAITGKRLDHPNCLKSYEIIDLGPERSPAVVSEYVEGTNLREFLDSVQSSKPRPRFSTLAATLILEQCFLGLREAHKAGLIHQDIKPENYLLQQWAIDRIKAVIDDPDALEDELLEMRDMAWVKLSDWGLSIFKERERGRDSESLSVSLSHIPEGKRGGTIVYMPLEQIDGVGISRRTDIFALSLIYYELLSGVSPIHARTTAEGLSHDCFEDLQVYLVQMISSSAQSAIDPKKDSALKSLKLSSRLQELLEDMSRRQKTERLTSIDLELELTEIIDELMEESPQSKALLYLSFLTFLIPVILYALITSVQNTPAKIEGPGKDKPELTKKDEVRGPDSPATVKEEVEPKQSKAYSEEDLEKLRQGDLMTAQKLKHIDKELGEVLGKWSLPILLLDKVETIDPLGAKGLANYTGGLLLRNLKTLSAEAMTELVKSKSFSLTIGFSEEVDDEVFEILGRFKGMNLSLLYRSPFQEKNARALAKFAGQELTLLAPTVINARNAIELARSQAKRLTIQYLVTVDGITALALAQFPGEMLSLPRLKTMSPQAGIAFGNCKSKMLSFLGLRTLKPREASALAKFKGEKLVLKMDFLSFQTKRALFQFKGTIVNKGKTMKKGR